MMTMALAVSRRAVLGGGAMGCAYVVAGQALAQTAALPLMGVSHFGEAVDDGDIKGWRLVYFGYTFCPDVCPVGLMTISQALEMLGPLGERFTPVFVTVDPERDRPALMKDYVGYFHPRFIGLTPSDAQLKAMAAAWRVKYQKVEGSAAGSYTVDHTASVFMLNPQGQILGRFPHDLSPQAMADKIRQTILRAR